MRVIARGLLAYPLRRGRIIGFNTVLALLLQNGSDRLGLRSTRLSYCELSSAGTGCTSVRRRADRKEPRRAGKHSVWALTPSPGNFSRCRRQYARSPGTDSQNSAHRHTERVLRLNHYHVSHPRVGVFNVEEAPREWSCQDHVESAANCKRGSVIGDLN